MSAGVCLGPQFTSRFVGRRGFPCGSTGKKSACNVGDLGSTAGSWKYPGEEKGHRLQYSSLDDSVDCIVHGITKSQTQLSNFH